MPAGRPRKGIYRNCLNCERSFYLSQSHAYNKKIKFCSTKCYHKFRHSQTLRHRPKCIVCNKPLGPHRKCFCSMKHRRHYQKSHRIEPINCKCKTCGKIVKRYPYEMKLGLGKYCSFKCRGLGHRRRINKKCIHCGEKFWTWLKNHEDPQRGKYCSRLCFMKHYPKSALEDRVELLLNKHKIPFTREFKVGRFHLDFLIGERIDLECDGEFYHSLPEAAKKDKRRDHILKKMGYRIIRLSGKSITKNPERCLNRITRMIEKMEE